MNKNIKFNIKPNKIEDLWPLTIIMMRYGGKIIIVRQEIDQYLIDIQSDEELYYISMDVENLDSLYNKLYNEWGIGDTIDEAFRDLVEHWEERK